MESIVKISLDGKPFEKLIDVVSKGIGTLYRPRQIIKEADARAYEIKVIEEAKSLAASEAKLIESVTDERIAQRLVAKEKRRQENIDSVVVDFKSDYKKMSKEFSNVGTLLARVTSVFTKIDSSLKVITGKIEKDNIIGNVGEIVKEVKDISKKVNVIVDEFSKNPNRFIKLF